MEKLNVHKEIAAISRLKQDIEWIYGDVLDQKIKNFGTVRVYYQDHGVKSFKPESWIKFGEDILKMNVKVKRRGRN